FFPNVVDVDRFALVGEGGVAGDDKQAGETGEVGGEDFGDAVAEVVLLGILAQVIEGQDNNGGLVGEGQRRGGGFRTEGWGLRPDGRTPKMPPAPSPPPRDRPSGGPPYSPGGGGRAPRTLRRVPGRSGTEGSHHTPLGPGRRGLFHSPPPHAHRLGDIL